MFLSIDGIDGAGKSTQLRLLAEYLRAQGRDVILCRDPGSTSLGESLRAILLDSRSHLSRRAEMLLYMAARAQLVDEVIAPALAKGKTVLSDRFLLANVVYQGHAGGLDAEAIWNVGCLATCGLMPDLTIVLDVAPEEAASRMDRPLDRMESRGEEYRLRLRQGFLAEAARRPDKIVVVCAAGTVEEVQARVQSAVATRFAP